MWARVGSYVGTNASSQDITGLPGAPKAIILLSSQASAHDTRANHSLLGIGFAAKNGAGTITQRSCTLGYRDGAATSIAERNYNNKLAGYTDGILSVNSVSVTAMLANGFTVADGGNNSTVHFQYMAMGGADLQAELIATQWPTSGASFTVTGMGFKPTCAFFISGPPDADAAADSGGTNADCTMGFGFAAGSGQAGCSWSYTAGDTMTSSMNLATVHSSAAALMMMGLNADTVDGKGIVASFDTDGLTITNSNAPTAARKVFTLGLSWGADAIQTFANTVTRAATGTTTDIVDNSGTRGKYVPNFAVMFTTPATVSETVILGTAEVSIGFADLSGAAAVSAAASVSALEAINTNADMIAADTTYIGYEWTPGVTGTIDDRASAVSWGGPPGADANAIFRPGWAASVAQQLESAIIGGTVSLMPPPRLRRSPQIRLSTQRRNAA